MTSASNPAHNIVADVPPPRAATTNRRLPLWRRNPSLVLGFLLILIIVGGAVVGPILMPYDPNSQDLLHTLAQPSPAHLLGTDSLGRDIFSRMLSAGRVDLQIGFICVLFPFVIGSACGCLAGYYGGVFDTVIMRVIDVVVAFPFFVLILSIVAMLGPGLINLYIAVSLVSWISYARIVRGEMLVARQSEYVLAAKVIGYSDVRIIARHLLPNIITSAIVFSMSDFVLDIVLGASLSFFGLGAQPPTPEWGAMISDGRVFMTTDWWIATFPGLAIVLVGAAFSLFGDGLADALRPPAA